MVIQYKKSNTENERINHAKSHLFVVWQIAYNSREKVNAYYDRPGVFGHAFAAVQHVGNILQWAVYFVEFQPAGHSEQLIKGDLSSRVTVFKEKGSHVSAAIQAWGFLNLLDILAISLLNGALQTGCLKC